MRISDWSSDVCSSDLGNSEIVLDRKVADKRIFPALDVGRTGTRKEELLVEKDKLSKMWVLRRILMQMGTIDAMEFLLDKMKDSKTNEDFFDSMNQSGWSAFECNDRFSRSRCIFRFHDWRTFGSKERKSVG